MRHMRRIGRIPLLVLATILFTLLYTGFFLQQSSFQRVDKVTSSVYYFFYPQKSISCYRLQAERLPDISDYKVRPGKSIFFHETSCRSAQNGKITILPRQACAVESAAKLNPNYDVYLTFASPGIFRFEDDSESDRMLQRLQEYPNIKILHLNYENYTKDTPLEELYSTGTLDSSFFAQSHASDVLRYLTLYKYGGIYLDMDVIVIKSLENLDVNYAGAESETNIGAGVVRFSHDGIGHEHASSCVEDLKNNFQTRAWGNNGPGVITRLSRKLCGVQLARDMLHKDCKNYTTYPEYMFYPVPWGKWFLYFDTDKVSEVFDMCRDSYIVHVWNKHSTDRKIPIGERTAYTEYAKLHCPKVFRECDKYF